MRLLSRDRTAAGVAVRRFRGSDAAPGRRRGARRRLASAMLDVSDGLVQDLGHLCDASRVGARVGVEAFLLGRRAPRRRSRLALRGGEDYELLFTVPAAPRTALAAKPPRRSTAASAHRRRSAAPARRVVDARGRAVAVEDPGFDHFRG
ncbi:MAG: hypothetical protein U0802_11485 [Candidatus Binatia bacterium]